MSEAVVDIQQSGNNLGVRLPAAVKPNQPATCSATQPKLFDWRLGKANPYPLKSLPGDLFVQVCERLNQMLQIGSG